MRCSMRRPTVTGEDEDSVKQRLAHRHGGHHRRPQLGVALHAHRALRFNQSRAVAIDMESATVAAQGYRFRVPYGTLLCVSDKPLHGELKLPGQANAFYERAISQHLQDRHRGAGAPTARGRRPPQPQAPQLRRTAAALADQLRRGCRDATQSGGCLRVSSRARDPWNRDTRRQSPLRTCQARRTPKRE